MKSIKRKRFLMYMTLLLTLVLLAGVSLDVQAHRADAPGEIYNLRLDPGKGDGEAETIQCNIGDMLTIPECTYSKTGYLFKNWNTKRNGKGKIYKAGQQVPALSKKADTTVSLYAQWTPIKYTIVFDANGGTGSMKRIKNCKYGTKYNLKANTFKRKGYTFAGWNLSSDGMDTSYKNKAKVRNLSVKDADTVTLYAQWKANSYQITFKPKGGTMSKTRISYTIEDAVKLEKPVRDGYTFLGWYSNAKYKESSRVKSIAKGTTGKKTLYAKWKKGVVSVAEDELEEDAAFYQEILDKVELRKEQIRNSETTVQIQGTAYYVSSSAGDDNNDGLSPETAWKTLEKVTNYQNYQKGDGILLKRGDEFRGCINFWDKPGLTVSAYGEGAKPLILGSIENGAGEEKWELVPGTNNIWVYYREFPDCGSVTFNKGESYADKFNVYWNGQIFTKAGTDEPFDVAKDLNDMSFFCNIDYTERSKNAENYNPDRTVFYTYGAEDMGKLYLRCDAGNPGKLYNDIEFSVIHALISAGAEATIDNLCLYYANNNAIFFQWGDSGSVLTNCEIAFMGDAAIGFNSQTKNASTGGEGTNFNSYGSVCKNNYIHDGRQGSFTIETGWDGVVDKDQLRQGGLTCTGNILEKCHKASIGLTCFQMSDSGFVIEDILVEDNYFVDIGYDYKTVNPENDPTDVAHGIFNIWMGGDSELKNMVVRNNIFFRSYNSLFTILNISEGAITFDGNTYVQGKYSKVFDLSYKDPNNSKNYVCYAYDEAEFEKGVRDILGDKNATVYTYYNNLLDLESEKAKALNIIPDSAPNDLSKQITVSEMISMLSTLVDKLGTAEQKADWNNVSQNAAQISSGICRADAMLAFFEMAYALDKVNLTESSGNLFLKIEKAHGNAWDDYYNILDASLFPNSGDISRYEMYEGMLISHLAYLYSMECSPASNQYYFKYDSENNTMHCSDPMTWEDAIKCCVWFYDGVDPLAFRDYLP